VTNAEADMLVMPKDSKHREEAFAFIRYVSSQKPLEKLALGQRKFSPLREVSEEFWQKHPHPYIRLFQRLGQSPNAWSVPKSGVWNEYLREMVNGVDLIQNLTQAPGPSLNQVELRIQASLDRDRMITSRREGTRASVEAETVRSAAK